MIKKTKKFKHMGMELTEEEHEEWHREHNDVVVDLQKHLKEKIGLTIDEDKKLHEKRKSAA
jgi:hypothetical protein